MGKTSKKYDSKNGANDVIKYHTSENIHISEFAYIDPEKEEIFIKTFIANFTTRIRRKSYIFF